MRVIVIMILMVQVVEDRSNDDRIICVPGDDGDTVVGDGHNGDRSADNEYTHAGGNDGNVGLDVADDGDGADEYA